MADIHNPKVIGDMTLTRAPSRPEHPVRKQDLEDAIANFGSSRALFVTDITPTGTGIVSDKVYAESLPANSILRSAVADTENVRVHFTVQGAVFTPPEVTVNGVAGSNFTPVGAGSDLFNGYADITMNASGDITVVSGTGIVVAELTVATEGPAVSMLNIGVLPGTQTEVKAGDVVSFSAIVENSAVSATVRATGAAASGSNISFGAADSAGEGFKTLTGNFTVANRNGLHNLVVFAANALGTAGEDASSVNQITLNQTAPTLAAISVTYPSGKGALNIGDEAVVTSAVTNADAVSYTMVGGSVTEPSVYGASKSVVLEEGTYNYSTNNYTITAVKASNGATATRSGVVRVAVTSPSVQITVDGSPARLRTDADGVNYTVRVTSNQQLSGQPVVEASVGEFIGEWTGNGLVYTRTLVLKDSDARGTLTVEADVTGLSGVAGNRTHDFIVGGFLSRTVVVPAFSQIVPLDVSVANISKVRVTYAGSSTLLTLRADKEDFASSFTIVNAAGEYDPNGNHLWLSDVAYTGANTSGTLQVVIEEII